MQRPPPPGSLPALPLKCSVPQPYPVSDLQGPLRERVSATLQPGSQSVGTFSAPGWWPGSHLKAWNRQGKMGPWSGGAPARPVGHVWLEGESVRGSAGWCVGLVGASLEAGLGW